VFGCPDGVWVVLLLKIIVDSFHLVAKLCYWCFEAFLWYSLKKNFVKSKNIGNT
jgi:hypothetical protein